jgi:phage gp46-like protein
MTDVLLFQTNDNGEMEIEGGLVTLTPGLDTSAYLSLFGGNWKDDGSQNNRQTWWGNLDETELAKRYRSETQYLLGTIPATSRNLRRIEDAATRDLQWLLDESIASSLTVSASLIGLNRVKIGVIIRAEGDESQFNYTENWRAST